MKNIYQLRSNLSNSQNENLIQLQKSDCHILRLPSRFAHGFAGVEAGFVQALITWSQTQNQSELRTYAADENDIQMSRITNQLSGMAATLLAEKCTNTTGDLDITHTLRKKALERLEILQSPKARSGSKGQQLEIICADHINRSYAYLFHRKDRNGNYSLREAHNFVELAQYILKVTSDGRLAMDYFTVLSVALGHTIHELIKNTEDHALTDILGNKIKKSLRGLHARFHRLTPEAVNQLVEYSSPLADYCSKLKPDPLESSITFLEISIFDSGPGFAQTWTRKPLISLSIEDEREAVEACFSAKTSKQHAGYGQGLPQVISILRQLNGFIKLRTGRLSLFSDLYGSQTDLFSPIVLDDYFRNQHNECPQAAGSLLTLIFPLNKNL